MKKKEMAFFVLFIAVRSSSCWWHAEKLRRFDDFLFRKCKSVVRRVPPLTLCSSQMNKSSRLFFAIGRILFPSRTLPINRSEPERLEFWTKSLKVQEIKKTTNIYPVDGNQLCFRDLFLRERKRVDFRSKAFFFVNRCQFMSKSGLQWKKQNYPKFPRIQCPVRRKKTPAPVWKTRNRSCRTCLDCTCWWGRRATCKCWSRPWWSRPSGRWPTRRRTLDTRCGSSFSWPACSRRRRGYRSCWTPCRWWTPINWRTPANAVQDQELLKGGALRLCSPLQVFQGWNEGPSGPFSETNSMQTSKQQALKFITS